MNRKEATIDKLQSRLDEWRAKIAVLEAKANQAKAESKITYLNEVRDLKRRQQEAGQKLDELRKAGADAADELKSGIERAWDDLGNAIKRAAEHF